ncbi:MAG: molecular chaperone TorD family protein [Eggerthellaceae bacterium]|nr:molecular chaperone TorD family protein [Eggerthellaceae bacterium]
MENAEQRAADAQVKRQEMLDFLNADAQTYRFLSQMFFKELNDEAIDALAAEEWPEDTGNAHLDRGYELLRRYFAFSGSDRRGQLAVEYARVFLAAGVFTREARTAVPYESVFTSEDRGMMGDARDDVAAHFAEDGFLVNPELHEPEDHVAFELEYLSVMSERAAKLLEEGERDAFARNVQRQIEFIEKHLLNWIGALHDAAKEYAKTTFYTGMLQVAWGALEQSLDMLRECSARC